MKMSKTKKQLKNRELIGELFAVELEDRGTKDQHTMINLYSEDDERYHQAILFSSYWIDDLIDVLERTKRRLENSRQYTEDGDFGYRRK